MVGAVRFELTTSCTRNKRASQATLRPDRARKRAGFEGYLQLNSAISQTRAPRHIPDITPERGFSRCKPKCERSLCRFQAVPNLGMLLRTEAEVRDITHDRLVVLSRSAQQRSCDSRSM